MKKVLKIMLILPILGCICYMLYVLCSSQSYQSNHIRRETARGTSRTLPLLLPWQVLQNRRIGKHETSIL